MNLLENLLKMMAAEMKCFIVDSLVVSGYEMGSNSAKFRVCQR